MNISYLLSSPPDDSCGPAMLGCQLDNSSTSMASSSRRIIQIKYSLDIVMAIKALFSQKGDVYSQYQPLSSSYVCTDAEDMSCAEAECIGVIYFPSKVTFQAAGTGSVFVNSHR
jgi:hypothetical protein